MEAGQPLKKPPGYAVPTTAPPPQGPRKTLPPRPTYYNPKRKNYGRRGICCRLCCWLLCIFLVVAILLAVAGAVFYLWFQPKSPVFRFRPVELTKFAVAGDPGSDSAKLDIRAMIRVEVRNPNSKIRIYYGEIAVALTADDTDMGTAKAAAFVQAPGNVTMLRFPTKVEGREVDATVAAALAARMKSKAAVVSAAVKTKVGIGVGKMKLGMLPVNVNCGGVSLKDLEGGKVSPRCTFTTLRWIKFH